MVMKAVLIRLEDNDENQSLGAFYLFDGIYLKFQGKSLELPDRGNKKMVSRIPEGTYTVKRRSSQKFGEHFHITGVPDRKYILIHVGNYYRQTHGCVLLGQNFVDVNGDGSLDVTISRPTMEKLLEVAPEGFELRVVDVDK